MRPGERIAEKVLAELARWEEERPKRERGRMLFYCPVCTSAYSVSYSTYKRRGAPHCLRCGVEMVRYDEDAFARRRRELAKNAKKIMTLVDIFAKAAEIYGRTLLRWSLHDGYITFRLDELDPTEFEYDFAHDVVRARFYYFDVPRYREAADYLMAEVRRLGLRLELQIYPPHTDPSLLPEGAKYDVEIGHYIVAP